MIGKDSSTQSLGIVPCAISWLFKLINERKEKTGTRFSVRVSAVEIFGKDEELKDLLAEVSTGSLQEGQSPGIHLREDPICGTQVRSPPPLFLCWLIPPFSLWVMGYTVLVCLSIDFLPSMIHPFLSRRCLTFPRERVCVYVCFYLPGFPSQPRSILPASEIRALYFHQSHLWY